MVYKKNSGSFFVTNYLDCELIKLNINYLLIE